MKKTLILAILLTMAAGLALAQCPDCAQGQGMQGKVIEKREMRMQGGPGMRGKGMEPWWKNPETVKALALTDKQVSDIDDLTTKHQKDMVKLDADLKIMRIDMRQLIENNAADKDIRDKSKQVSQLKQKMHDAMLEHMLDLRRVLTADQQKKLKELKQPHGRGGMMMNMDDKGPDKD